MMTSRIAYNDIYIVDRTTMDSNGCWLWNRCLSDDGYGKVNPSSGEYAAHRLSYTIFTGPIPEDKVVRHKCHVRACCNPEHLELGSVYDNNEDAFIRGSRTRTPLAALEVTRSSQALIGEIKRLTREGVHFKEIARQLNTSKSNAFKYAKQQKEEMNVDA